MTYGIIEDASKPAPMMAELLRRLTAHDPYGGSTDPEYRRAIDRINEVFGAKVESDLRFTMELQAKRRKAV